MEWEVVLQLLEILVLGLVQGIAEIFPVSSSGHLSIASTILADVFHLTNTGFETAVLLHFGTFVATLLFYQKDVLSLWRSAVASLVRRIRLPLVPSITPRPCALGEQTPYLLLVSLVLTGLLGLALKRTAEQWFDSPLVIGPMLALNGLIICLFGRSKAGSRKIYDLVLIDYVVVGVAQGIAVLPGFSRFGFILCAALWRRMEWFEALKLSFLLSLPTVLAAGAYELYTDSFVLWSLLEVLGTLLGIIAAAIGGYVAIKVLLVQSLHARKRLPSFGVYCISLGVFILAYAVALLGDAS